MERIKNKKSFNLANFKRAQANMTLENEVAWRDSYSGRSKNKASKDYKKEEIEDIINSSDMACKIKLSRNYFQKSGFYRHIILHYATVLKYSGIMIPNVVQYKKITDKAVLKRYNNGLAYIDDVITDDIMLDWSIKVLTDGVYYGVIQKSTKNELVVLSLPPLYCARNFVDYYGKDILEFNTSFFSTIIVKADRDNALETYPKYIRKHFRAYEAGRASSSWVRIPPDEAVFFSLMKSGMPFFLNTIVPAIKYDETVDIQQERDLEEIRKVLIQKIPHLNDGTLLFEPEEAADIHAGSVAMMKGNKNVSVLTTYAEVDSITSHSSSEAQGDSLTKMSQNVYTQAGISAEIFAPTNSQSVKVSTTNDMALMLTLGNQYARFVQDRINQLFANSTISFKYKMLPITHYNQSDYIADSLKLAQSGYSFLLPGIAMGLSQREIVSIKKLENEALGLQELFIPVASSYTQSADADNTGGAPEVDLEDKSDKTIQNDDAKNK